MKYMLEFFTPFLVAGIVIVVIAGRQRYKDNKIIEDFNRERENRQSGGFEEAMHKHFYKEKR